MSNRLAELQQCAVETQAAAVVGAYTDISQLTRFAHSNEFALAHMRRLEDSAAFDDAQKSAAVIGGGWLALEIAASVRAQTVTAAVAKRTHYDLATARFSRAAEGATADADAQPAAKYVAGIGLIATALYRGHDASAVKAASVMYTSLLDSLLHDDKFRTEEPETADSMIDKLVFAGLVQRSGGLAVPASLRQSHPLRATQPLLSHDFLTWRSPHGLPAKPERQVKIKPVYEPGEKPHAGHITVMRVGALTTASPETLAGSLIASQNKQPLDRAASEQLARATKRANRVLRRVPEPSAVIEVRGRSKRR